MPRSGSPVTVEDARRRRREVAKVVSALAPDLDLASAAMARRFAAGAMLHPTGVGVGAIDAAHVTVEFIHPVIVGKRAVPSLTVPPADVGHASAESVVLGLRRSSDVEIGAVLEGARGRGCLAIDLCTGPVRPAAAVNHQLHLSTADALVGRELQVTVYHVLWEMVHEYLDGGAFGSSTTAPDGLRQLYPFLYDRPGNGRETARGLTDHVVGSIVAKASEIATLRDEVLRVQGEGLVSSGAVLRHTRDVGGRVWTFGNGGSSTDAQAIAHLLRTHDLEGARVDARSLSDDVATLTAVSNDVSFDVVFARMLRSLARPGDVAIGLSTSGGSRNVLAALEAASAMGLHTIGFAGYDGGDMRGIDGLDQLLVVRSSSVHRIQEAQTTLAHVLVELARS